MRRRATAIFVGEVLEVRPANDEEFRRYLDHRVVRIHVEQYWKGIKNTGGHYSRLGPGVVMQCPADRRREVLDLRCRRSDDNDMHPNRGSRSC